MINFSLNEIMHNDLIFEKTRRHASTSSPKKFRFEPAPRVVKFSGRAKTQSALKSSERGVEMLKLGPPQFPDQVSAPVTKYQFGCN